MFEDIDIKFRKTNVVEISWLPCVRIHCLILRVQQCRDESKIYNYQQMVFASDVHWHRLFRLLKRLYRPPTHILSISWLCMCSLRKQPRFGDATAGFPAKWRLRNERRNSILITRHTDLGSACDWLNQIFDAVRPIRSSTQIWVVTRHQYGISALVSQTSFGGDSG